MESPQPPRPPETIQDWVTSLLIILALAEKGELDKVRQAVRELGEACRSDPPETGDDAGDDASGS